MRKRNLILIALAVTLVLVFTQIGAVAAPGACVLTPSGGCPICPLINGASCHAGGFGCDAPNYWSCCNWAMSACEEYGKPVRDNTNCGLCCAN
ncbi:hypothetical protein KY348_00665 [Candidatus Woesearchaeota archaeon]|nr:hypothetical protein [Candidatus Woesearchaeota archaeon]